MKSLKANIQHLICYCLFFVCALSAQAEILVLRTGARVEGIILFQNEDVVILSDASGARFQYPRADIEQILTKEENTDSSHTGDISSPLGEAGEGSLPITSTKKASILLELAGGATPSNHLTSTPPSGGWGASFSADILVGSHHIGSRHLFIGGGLGYHAFVHRTSSLRTLYSFLPIQAALRMPLLEQTHAPMFGLSLGYGIALSKDYKGGLYAGLDVGYRYQINPKSALALTAFAHFQQTTITVTEDIEGTSFTNYVGRNLLATGLKLSLYF